MPPYRWCVVPARLDAVDQTQQVLLQIGRILRCRLAVHTGRAVLPSAFVGIQHPLVINMVMQCADCHPWIVSRQFGYLLLFRLHALRSQSTSVFLKNSSGLEILFPLAVVRIGVSANLDMPMAYCSKT